MSPSTWGASRSQREVYLPYSAGEAIRNRHAISTEKQVKIMYRQAVSNSFLRPYILTTLHYYIITFSFSTSPFRPFALSQSSKQHPQKNEARSDAEDDFRSSSTPRKWLEKFFQRTKSCLCGKQKASTLSLFLINISIFAGTKRPHGGNDRIKVFMHNGQRTKKTRWKWERNREQWIANGHWK